ncbi:hypothetical protein LCGC14_0363840 [marine sediment metagenome]|uniref:Uncharacterized protein n=1 Tax=marine sediment metagenome TaxID=412755 RepID=A0A0F9T733_9ZZZZ
METESGRKGRGLYEHEIGTWAWEMTCNLERILWVTILLGLGVLIVAGVVL